MEHDTDKIDEAVLGLLWLTLHNEVSAWKTFDWDATDRLHERGLMHDPRNKNKSFHLTPEGVAAAKAAFAKLFTKPSPPAAKPPRPLPRR